MAFQFLCPQGHMLQGEPSQTGQKCKCPYCQTEFIVPQAPGGPPSDSAPSDSVPPDSVSSDSVPSDSAEPIYEEPGLQFDDDLPTEWQPGPSVGESIAGVDQVVAENPFETNSAAEQSTLHVPCPKGHVLETPRDMLGQWAQCPFCQEEFQLRFENSLECRKEKADLQERKEQKIGKAWMNWAIAAAVVVLFAVIIMVAVVSSG